MRIETSKTIGIGKELDREGRIICTRFGNLWIVNVYTPNTLRAGNKRRDGSYPKEHYMDRRRVWEILLDIKLRLLFASGEDVKVILCGDLNVARERKDIWHGQRDEDYNAGYNNRGGLGWGSMENEAGAGYRREERQAIEDLLGVEGRNFLNPFGTGGRTDLWNEYGQPNLGDEAGYTFWSPTQLQHRPVNKGWRIDYFISRLDRLQQDFDLAKTDIRPYREIGAQVFDDDGELVLSSGGNAVVASDHGPLVLRLKRKKKDQHDAGEKVEQEDLAPRTVQDIFDDIRAVRTEIEEEFEEENYARFDGNEDREGDVGWKATSDMPSERLDEFNKLVARLDALDGEFNRVRVDLIKDGNMHWVEGTIEEWEAVKDSAKNCSGYYKFYNDGFISKGWYDFHEGLTKEQREHFVEFFNDYFYYGHPLYQDWNDRRTDGSECYLAFGSGNTCVIEYDPDDPDSDFLSDDEDDEDERELQRAILLSSYIYAEDRKPVPSSGSEPQILADEGARQLLLYLEKLNAETDDYSLVFLSEIHKFTAKIIDDVFGELIDKLKRSDNEEFSSFEQSLIVIRSVTYDNGATDERITQLEDLSLDIVTELARLERIRNEIDAQESRVSEQEGKLVALRKTMREAPRVEAQQDVEFTTGLIADIRNDLVSVQAQHDELESSIEENQEKYEDLQSDATKLLQFQLILALKMLGIKVPGVRDFFRTLDRLLRSVDLETLASQLTRNRAYRKMLL